MFPSFKNLADRNNKKQALLKRIERDVAIDEAKRQAYASAVWASDVEANKIDLTKKEKESTKAAYGDILDKLAEAPARTSDAVRTLIKEIASKPVNNDQSPYDLIGDIGNEDDLIGDIGNEDDSMSSILDNEDDFYDAFDRLPETDQWRNDRVRLGIFDDFEDMEDVEDNRFYDELVQMYDNTPELSIKKYNPIDKEGDLIDNWYFVKKQDGLVSVVDALGRPISDTSRIDWRLTLSYIKAKDYLNINKEISAFDQLARNVVVNRQRNARTIHNQDSDGQHAFSRLRDVVKTVGIDKMRSIGVELILKDGTNIKNQYRFNASSLRPNLINNAKRIGNVDKKISWDLTLERLLDKIDKTGDDDLIEKTENARSTELVNRDREYYKAIRSVYSALPWLPEYKIHPIIKSLDSTAKLKFDKRYVFDVNGSIVNIDRGRRITKAEGTNFKNAILMERSFKHVQDRLREILNGMKEIPEMRRSDTDKKRIRDVSRVLEIINADTGVKNEPSQYIDPVLRDVSNESTADMLQGKGSRINTRGRGLMGTGPLNLRKIEGTGMASDLKYKRIGSKFIRLKDLHENKLKLVFPNRTQLGRIREISPALSAVINELLHDNNINQQLYDKLNINDKKLFHEILCLTHLQHTFKQPLQDPLEQLKAEFDKLRGQLMLGNDNPDLLRELKALSVDLYSNKLIDEEEFKQLFMI